VADIVNRDPAVDPPQLAGSIGAPASLDTVLAAGLAYRVDRRPPTAAILADALDVVAGELERGSSAPDGGRREPPSATSTVLTAPRATRIPAGMEDPPSAGNSGSAGPAAPAGPRNAESPARVGISGPVEPSTRQPRTRSPARFGLLVALACVILFVLSLVITVLLLR
jgi:hypothetical protein